jgi:hypothetical protein
MNKVDGIGLPLHPVTSRSLQSLMTYIHKRRRGPLGYDRKLVERVLETTLA